MLMLAVLVLQVLSAGQAFSAPPRDLMGGLVEDHLVVCTAGGLVELDAAGRPLPSTADHGGICVFCLPLLQGHLALPAAIGLIAWPERTIPPPPMPEATAVAAPPQRLCGSATPQAPPSS